MNNITELRLTSKSIERASEKLEKAQTAFNRACYDEFSKCNHRSIAEADYQSSDYGASPPWRICLHCGLGEEGWGCGFLVLTAKAFEPIDRDEIFRLMHARVRQSDQGPLLRRETTVDAIVRSQLGVTAEPTLPSTRLV